MIAIFTYQQTDKISELFHFVNVPIVSLFSVDAFYKLRCFHISCCFTLYNCGLSNIVLLTKNWT